MESRILGFNSRSAFSFLKKHLNGGKDMSNIKVKMTWGLSALLIFSFMACSKKQVIKKADEPKQVAEDISSEELDIHGKDFMSSQELVTIYFNYDSYNLSPEAREILSKNATYLKKNDELEILAEGHCDDRGTISYNLALGQKRSQIVRNYYTSLGIEGKRIGTVSFGEEKSLCSENSENCWQKNRRVETKIRTLKITENGKSE